MVVLWRGWVLWPRKRVVQTISVLLILGTIGKRRIPIHCS